MEKKKLETLFKRHYGDMLRTAATSGIVLQRHALEAYKLPCAIVGRKVFEVETLTGADVKHVALDVHPELREISLPLTSVEAKIEWAKELCRGDKRESEENN